MWLLLHSKMWAPGKGTTSYMATYDISAVEGIIFLQKGCQIFWILMQFTLVSTKFFSSLLWVSQLEFSYPSCSRTVLFATVQNFNWPSPYLLWSWVVCFFFFFYIHLLEDEETKESSVKHFCEELLGIEWEWRHSTCFQVLLFTKQFSPASPWRRHICSWNLRCETDSRKLLFYATSEFGSWEAYGYPCCHHVAFVYW